MRNRGELYHMKYLHSKIELKPVTTTQINPYISVSRTPGHAGFLLSLLDYILY